MRIRHHADRNSALTRSEVLIIVVVFGLGLLLFAIAAPCWVPARETAQRRSIASNLRIIEEAKKRWAAENQKKPEDLVSLTDLTAFFKNNSVLARLAGETYSVTTVGDLARATVKRKIDGKSGPFTTTSF